MRGAWRAVAAAMSAAVLLAACATSTPGHPALRALPPLSNAAAQPTDVPTVVRPAPSLPSTRVIATRRLTAIAGHLPTDAISVAVVNTRTGASYSWGATHGMWTGSVYKLLVLETLLLQRQDWNGWFNSSELADITAMIEQSKNDAGYRMYLDAGGSSALASAARKLGLRHTHIGVSDPAFTTMGARDGIALLHALISAGPLDNSSRRFVLDLMRNVQADQRWGAGVVADRGTPFANKNGWMQVDNGNEPDEDDGMLWLVDSLGIAQVHGQQLLIAVFTRHNPDRDTGIRLVERLVRLITPVVTEGRT